MVGDDTNGKAVFNKPRIAGGLLLLGLVVVLYIIDATSVDFAVEPIQLGLLLGASLLLLGVEAGKVFLRWPGQ